MLPWQVAWDAIEAVAFLVGGVRSRILVSIYKHEEQWRALTLSHGFTASPEADAALQTLEMVYGINAKLYSARKNTPNRDELSSAIAAVRGWEAQQNQPNFAALRWHQGTH